MDLVREIKQSSDKAVTPCIMRPTVAEKFYCRSKSKCTASGIGGSSSSYESQMKKSLETCNLIMGTQNVNVPKLFKAAAIKADSSGAGASQSFLNYENLQDMVEQLGNIGQNKSDYVLGPISGLLFDVITSDALKPFLDPDLYIPRGDSPLSKLTEIIKPSGIMSCCDKTSNYVPGIDNYTNDALIAGDMQYGEFKLHLPTDKCIGLEKIRRPSITTGSEMCLYMCIGPADEVLCVSPTETGRKESYVTTLTERLFNTKPDEVVKDQPYTTLFYFAHANATELGVIEDLSSRCLRYTKVAHLGPFYREIAVIRIGYLRGERAVIEVQDSTTTIRTMNLAIGEWKRHGFKYDIDVGVSRKRKYDDMNFDGVSDEEHDEESEEEEDSEEEQDFEDLTVGEPEALPTSNNDTRNEQTEEVTEQTMPRMGVDESGQEPQNTIDHTATTTQNHMQPLPSVTQNNTYSLQNNQRIRTRQRLPKSYNKGDHLDEEFV